MNTKRCGECNNCLKIKHCDRSIFETYDNPNMWDNIDHIKIRALREFYERNPCTKQEGK